MIITLVYMIFTINSEVQAMDAHEVVLERIDEKTTDHSQEAQSKHLKILSDGSAQFTTDMKSFLDTTQVHLHGTTLKLRDYIAQEYEKAQTSPKKNPNKHKTLGSVFSGIFKAFSSKAKRQTAHVGTASQEIIFSFSGGKTITVHPQAELKTQGALNRFELFKRYGEESTGL